MFTAQHLTKHHSTGVAETDARCWYGELPPRKTNLASLGLFDNLPS